MTGATRYVTAAVILAVAAGLLATVGLVERRIAAAERRLSTLDVTAALTALDDLQRRLRLTEPVPWLFVETRREVEARRAESRYWRGEYAALVAAYPDLGREEVRDNRPLQLTVAGAHLRSLELGATGDREVLLNGLDRVIALYRQVLRNTGGDRDAAYNYEVLVRRRTALAAGLGDSAPARGTPLGNQGSAGEEDMDMSGDMNDIQIYVPSDMLGRESTDEPTIGSDAPLRRRG